MSVQSLPTVAGPNNVLVQSQEQGQGQAIATVDFSSAANIFAYAHRWYSFQTPDVYSTIQANPGDFNAMANYVNQLFSTAQLDANHSGQSVDLQSVQNAAAEALEAAGVNSVIAEDEAQVGVENAQGDVLQYSGPSLAQLLGTT